MNRSANEHRQAGAGKTASCAVLTVSDSRTLETDGGGRLIVEALEEAGHRVVDREIVRDEPSEVGRLIGKWVRDEGIDLILTTGGTGLSSRDGTVEVVERYLDKRMDGFGELFRTLSFEEIGAAAMLSRATAGLAAGTLVFTMPGSPAAVRLALERLILPELGHLLFEKGR